MGRVEGGLVSGPNEEMPSSQLKHIDHSLPT